jgi:DNA-binding IclR family transcriptional regulator
MIRARESKSAPVGVIAKVLRILEALDGSPVGLQLHEIATQTQVNKSTAYRFLAHLESESYLFRDEAGAYVVGPKLARLGSGAAYHATLRNMGRPVLRTIAQVTKETVNLGTLDGHDVLYLDVMESPHTFRMVSQSGMRRPVHCTALGKAILAFLPAEQREEILPTLTFERRTRYTISNLMQLRKELTQVVRRGYALDNQETELGAVCVAAPILDESGKVAGALSVSGPVTRISPQRCQSLAIRLKSGTRRISEALGHTP